MHDWKQNKLIIERYSFGFEIDDWWNHLIPLTNTEQKITLCRPMFVLAPFSVDQNVDLVHVF